MALLALCGHRATEENARKAGQGRGRRMRAACAGFFYPEQAPARGRSARVRTGRIGAGPRADQSAGHATEAWHCQAKAGRRTASQNPAFSARTCPRPAGRPPPGAAGPGGREGRNPQPAGRDKGQRAQGPARTRNRGHPERQARTSYAEQRTHKGRPSQTREAENRQGAARGVRGVRPRAFEPRGAGRAGKTEQASFTAPDHRRRDFYPRGRRWPTFHGWEGQETAAPRGRNRRPPGQTKELFAKKGLCEPERRRKGPIKTTTQQRRDVREANICSHMRFFANSSMRINYTPIFGPASADAFLPWVGKAPQRSIRVSLGEDRGDR